MRGMFAGGKEQETKEGKQTQRLTACLVLGNVLKLVLD